MKVSVKWSKRVYADLELDPAAHTAVFKQLLFSRTGVEPEQQRLMVKGAMVKDQPDWSSFKKLRPGVTLVMMGSPMRAVFPERFSALQYLWETHSLQGRLTPLQASLLRLAISGMIHERLGENCWHIAAQDCDVLVRAAIMVVGSAKRVCAHPKAPFVFFSAGVVHPTTEPGCNVSHQFAPPPESGDQWMGLADGYHGQHRRSGVMYYISTEGGNTPWTNPHDVCRVAVTASAKDGGSNLSNFVCGMHQATGLCSSIQDGSSSWIQVDLGCQRRVSVQGYALRRAPVTDLRLDLWQFGSRDDVDECDQCAWELQGALEDVGPWVTLKRHLYEEDGRQVNDTTYWEVAPLERGGKEGGAGWRFLRILLVTPIGNPRLAQPDGPTNVLQCAGLEFWGTMADTEVETARRVEAVSRLTEAIHEGIPPAPEGELEVEREGQAGHELDSQSGSEKEEDQEECVEALESFKTLAPDEEVDLEPESDLAPEPEPEPEPEPQPGNITVVPWINPWAPQ